MTRIIIALLGLSFLVACAQPQRTWAPCPEFPDDCSSTETVSSGPVRSSDAPTDIDGGDTGVPPEAPATPSAPEGPEPSGPSGIEVPETPTTPGTPENPKGEPQGPVGQNPGNGKPVGNAPTDGERGEVPSGKEKKEKGR